MKKRILAFLLAALLVLALGSCSAKKTETKDDDKPTETQLDTEKEIKVAVLNGTTGFGMAKLMDDAANGNAALNYKFTVETDASVINAALINKSIDIAALPTNAASVVYNKTQGGIKAAAINTLGVLYVVEKGDSVKSVADLKGKTLYVPGKGSNPEYITNYILDKNGLKVGEDVTLDYSYAAPADLRTAVAAGKVDLAVLPEPMVTIAKSANAELNTALDLTAEWDKVADKGSLAQGCIVVTKDFAESNPNELNKFLEEYEASVTYVVDNPEPASQMIATHKVFEKAPVAMKAIPGCNLCFVKGEDMKTAFNAFLQVLFEANATAVGGKMPADDFYYIP